MSLDNIQLTKQTCKNLFGSNLVEISGTLPQEEVKTEHSISSLGENNQQILFVINDQDHKFLPDDELVLLSKLVSACKLTMADIALVNFYLNPFDYEVYLNHFHSRKILLFGVTTLDLNLPFNIPFFQIQQFREQLYLTAPSLKDLLKNPELKKKLWSNLQILFLNK